MTAQARVRLRPAAPDYVLMAIAGILVVVGVLAVFSSSFAEGYRLYGDVNYFFLRQAMWAFVGAVLMVTLMHTDYHLLRKASPFLMLLAVGSLIAVLTPGIGLSANGSTRWIQLGPLPAIQPSEFVKLAMVIYIAAWLTAKGSEIKEFKVGLLPFVLLVGAVGSLVMLQPDMGTVIIIVATTVTLFFIAGAELRHVAGIVGAGLVVGAILIAAGDYRAERFSAFLGAEDDPLGSGFQILQLSIALGSGGLTGLGWGVSRQKFFYIPGAHTDGIFAIIGEELGLLGLLVVIALFGFLIYRGFRTIIKAPDQFGMLLATGITVWIAYQALINVGGITRSLPLTGIPLPFISYGGSALAATMAAIGVLLNISRHGNVRKQPDFRSPHGVSSRRPITEERASRRGKDG
ncbi:MAG: putative lipid II flippase FtsW [Dehalococcoidia bacterium]|nr:putative lipid II flippase FtsW [Dehalococcoidia bacterium]